jgi:hypothetical protein
MATMYFVQGFRQKGRRLEPDQPQAMKSPEAAISTAERLASSKAGVWAYAANVDVETDTYDEPQVLFKAGALPAGLGE